MSRLFLFTVSTGFLLAGCDSDNSPNGSPQTVAVASIPGHQSLAQDNTPKEGQRMVPTEAYIRTYLSLFGGLTPLAAQALAAGGDGSELFDTWSDYLVSMGLPNYSLDIARATETNALRLATFERVGIALCDRCVEHDLRGAPPVAKRLIFAFAAPDILDDAGFAERFDVLHRTFLGYPTSLAPPKRVGRFYKLYNDTLARHTTDVPQGRRFNAKEAAWASICYALIRHPEFHLY